ILFPPFHIVATAKFSSLSATKSNTTTPKIFISSSSTQPIQFPDPISSCEETVTRTTAFPTTKIVEPYV
ncbi:unnamed protein product, partial [Prunus brigantina]